MRFEQATNELRLLQCLTFEYLCICTERALARATVASPNQPMLILAEDLLDDRLGIGRAIFIAAW